jgi:purine-binding chemotaxis protein CheW
VIVLRTEIDGREVMVGIVVDAVSEVYQVEPSDIRETPNFGNHVDSRFITAMATVAEKIIILLDSEMLLDADELYNVTRQTHAV